jgi:hypothetical protein
VAVKSLETSNAQVPTAIIPRYAASGTFLVRLTRLPVAAPATA